MVLPNFICPGAARSATTTLYYLLIQHPRVFLPQIKETRFFALDYDKGLSWYEQKYYADAKEHIAVGDISPVYLIHDKCPARIRECLGSEIKLIFMLRNPVERAYSHYSMLRHHQFEDLPFEKALALGEKERIEKSLRFYGHEYGFQYLKESSYFQLIQRYLRYYPLDQMTFVLFEDFAAETERCLAGILQFLGVHEPHQFRYEVYQNQAVAAGSHRISRLFYCNPVAKKMRDFIQQHTSWKTQSALKKLKNVLLGGRKSGLPPLNEETRISLQEYFAGEIARLETLTGLDLSGWRERPRQTGAMQQGRGIGLSG